MTGKMEQSTSSAIPQGYRNWVKFYKLEGISAIQRYLKWLEKWSNRNLTKFHKGKVLYLCWNNRLGANQMENSFAEKVLGSKLNRSQKHDLAAETTTHWAVLAKV